MGIPGSYLTLEVGATTVAETTDVNLKVAAKALDSTSKSSGLNSEYIGGTVRIAAAGSFLMASDGANWSTLWSSFKDGDEVVVHYYRNGVGFLSGNGVIKKLTMKGGLSDSLITGTYGLRFTYESEQEISGEYLTTEAGVTITTEGGDPIQIDGAADYAYDEESYGQLDEEGYYEMDED